MSLPFQTPGGFELLPMCPHVDEGGGVPGAELPASAWPPDLHRRAHLARGAHRAAAAQGRRPRGRPVARRGPPGRAVAPPHRRGGRGAHRGATPAPLPGVLAMIAAYPSRDLYALAHYAASSAAAVPLNEGAAQRWLAAPETWQRHLEAKARFYTRCGDSARGCADGGPPTPICAAGAAEETE